VPFLQANLVEEDGGRSGAEIRNEHNFQVLSGLLTGTRVFLRRAVDVRRRPSPTVPCLDQGDVTLLLEAVTARKTDFVMFEGVALLHAMEAVRRSFPTLPIIVDFHNVESQLYRDVRMSRYARLARPLARLLFARRFRKAEEDDREAARIADAVWTCSTEDADFVREARMAKSVHIVPNPIPDWCWTIAPDRGQTARPTVLFVGHLGYAPNRGAIAELVKPIMRDLRHRFPDADLHVCGRAPREKLARMLKDHGHRLTANPSDLAPVYRDAAATAIPLREGGGTRIKVLEALAVGCPVVATAKAVEGLALEDGRHFLRAETASDFVSALARLFEDHRFGQRLAAEGRDFVLRSHGNAARAEAVQAALASMDIQ